MLDIIRETLPIFEKQKSGHYVNFSSIFGVWTVPTFSIYASSKFTVEGFSKAMAAELEQFGIKITIVEPGVFLTEFKGHSRKLSEPMSEYAPIYEVYGIRDALSKRIDEVVEWKRVSLIAD